jgi:hypothetical protein
MEPFVMVKFGFFVVLALVLAGLSYLAMLYTGDGKTFQATWHGIVSVLCLIGTFCSAWAAAHGLWEDLS